MIFKDLFTQNIMYSISMMEKLNNFIENDFKIVNWHNKSIENSFENFEIKLNDIFIKKR